MPYDGEPGALRRAAADLGYDTPMGSDPRNATPGAPKPQDRPSWALDGPATGIAPAPMDGPGTESRQRLEPGAWHLAERAARAQGAATYRGSSSDDWRRDLADQSDFADQSDPAAGEPQRYGGSEYAPFRASGSAAVPQPLGNTATSLISPVPQRESWARGSGAFQSLSGSYERRPVTGSFPTIRRSDLLDPDDDEEDDLDAGGPLAAVGYTVIWYGVPIVLFVLYMLLVNTGSRAQALSTLASAAPQFGISLVLSVIVAVGIRKVSVTWKAISVGLASAVVGGGMATVISSAITGNSLS
jgi:hypothetical protein